MHNSSHEKLQYYPPAVTFHLMFLRFPLLRGHFTAEHYGKEIALDRDTLAKYDGQHWREFLQMWPATE